MVTNSVKQRLKENLTSLKVSYQRFEPPISSSHKQHHLQKMFRHCCSLVLCVLVVWLLSITASTTATTHMQSFEHGRALRNSTRALLQKREFYFADFYTGSFSRDVWSAALLSDNAYEDKLPALKGTYNWYN